MRWPCALFLILGGLPGPLVSPTYAQSATTAYALSDSSALQMGCFEPCPCPVLECLSHGQSIPAHGTFRLTQTGADRWFRYFDVTDIRWIVSLSGQIVQVSGSGTYREGGDLVIAHQLALDLSLDGGAPRHFDSGLVVACSCCPTIDVVISLHGLACDDTAFRVVASPPAVAGVGDAQGPQGLGAARPNPFLNRTDFDFRIDRAAAVNLSIYDPQGREARALLRAVWLDAGSHSITWDGKNGDGTECSPGVYFVRMRVEGREHIRTLMKLR
jgi:hypothetical protein